MKGSKRFLILFYAYRFFIDFVLLYPVYMLLLESKGLSVFDISWLLMIWSVPVFLLEIPSGILADRWSRKYAVVIGTACKLVCFLLWLFAEGFFLFALGFVFWGVQEAFCSGSVQALLYDVLEKYGAARQYERYAGRAAFYGGMGIALSMLLGGWAASAGFDLAGRLSAVSIFIAVLCALLLEDAKKTQAEGQSPMRYVQTLKDGLLRRGENGLVVMPLLFCSLVAIVPGILEEYDQMYAHRIGLSIGMVGVWGGVRTGLEALGSRFAFVLKKWFGSIRRLCLPVIAGGVLLFVSVYADSIYLLPVYGLFYAVISGVTVLTEGMLLRHIPSARRATILSVSSLLMNVFGLALYLGFAGASALGDLRTGFLAMAGYMMIVAVVFLLVGGIKQEARR